MADRIIDVFLAFDKGDRNTITTRSGGKTVTKAIPGPSWGWLVGKAAKKGFRINVFGPAFRPSASAFTDSLKNSEVTILIGHGGGNFVNKKWVSSQVELADGMVVTPNDANLKPGLYITKDGKTVSQSAPPKINKVTGIFTCNSHDVLPKAFEIPEGDVLITNDGGDDGLTRVGTLENTGFAFVEAYINSGGDVKGSVQDAQRQLDQGSQAKTDKDLGTIQGDPGDKGDKLHIDR